jgi:hypothetical protein
MEEEANAKGAGRGRQPVLRTSIANRLIEVATTEGNQSVGGKMSATRRLEAAIK